VFDIVAGASAGAINACIIVSHVIHSKNHDKLPRWKGSVQKVLDFWHDTSSSPDFTKWKPFFSYDWPFFNNEDAWITVSFATKKGKIYPDFCFLIMGSTDCVTLMTPKNLVSN
jgi:predicted acylesterase/phospholipase RssA